MVIAPAKTGRDSNNRIAVTKIDHTNNGMLCILIPGARIFRIVVMKFAAPKIDLAPARWSLKIAKSTEGPEWACTLESGG